MTYKETAEKIFSEAFPQGNFKEVMNRACPQFFFDNAVDECKDKSYDGCCDVCWGKEYKEDKNGFNNKRNV